MTTERAIVFAPTGRDATIAGLILGEAGIRALPVPSIQHLVDVLDEGAGFVVLAEEATRDADLRSLRDLLARQDEWSDLPFILLTSQGGSLERNPAAGRYLEMFGNVTFVERPFHPTTLVSVARAALRARRRQYDARARLETIRLGEERLRVAVTAGRLGAWSFNVADRHLETSALCKAHYGRAPDEDFSFEDLLSGVHTDDLPEVRAAMEASLLGKGDYAVDYRFIWPDGTTHWLQLRGGLDRTGPHGTISISGVSSDVTDAKNSELAVRRSEDRFRAAVAAVQGVVWTNTAEGEMRGEQPGWASLTGQTLEEYQGFGWAKALHPEDAQPTIDAWKESLEQKKPFIFAHRVNLRDGSWGEFAIRAIPTFLPDGAIREWVGVHTNVTQQRANERALADLNEHLEERIALATTDLISSQSRLRSIFESSFQYFGEINPEGILIDANATSLAAIDKRRDEVIGMPFAQTPWFKDTPGGPEAARVILEKALAGQRVRQEATLKLPAGLRHFDFSVRPVQDAEGRVIAAVPEAIDITERRSAEEKLLQSQKLETIGQLTGGVAHDFNNLLTPVIGTLDFIRRRLANDELSVNLLDGALASAERGRILIQRLLAFARRQPLQATAVDVAALIRGMEDLITRSLDPRIVVTMNLANDLPAVAVDANQLELAILNLAVNARDAMPGGGQLSITTKLAEIGEGEKSDLIAGSYVCIGIEDTGEGMDAETLSRAIEPFFSTKRVGEGTGLGLSMVHGFASQTGGTIDIDSTVGSGTRINVWLPLADSALTAPIKTQSSPEQSVSASGIKVLLVDDDTIVRLNCAEGLRDLGFEVVDVPTPNDALETMCTDASFDVVVTDYLMPNMTGLELAASIAQKRPQLPVLFYNGLCKSERRTDE